MPEQPAATRFPGCIRQLLSRTPLRVKLISAVLAMVAVALVIISVAGISALKGYLLGQADSQLQSVTDASEPQHWVGQYLITGTQFTSPNYATDWVPAGGHAPAGRPAGIAAGQCPAGIQGSPGAPCAARARGCQPAPPGCRPTSTGSSPFRPRPAAAGGGFTCFSTHIKR